MRSEGLIYPLNEETLRGRLQELGVLPTRQRLAVARVLFRRPRHLSAEQVREEASRDGDPVSKATVYNTLHLFAAVGLVREVIVDPTRVFYDPNTHEHHHFFNVDTGQLTDIDTAELPLANLPTAPAGTVAEGVDVIIRLRNA